MKKKKIATIIASGSLVGSLLLGGNAYATTTDTPVIQQSRRQNTEYPRKYKNTNKKKSDSRYYMASSTPRFLGTIQSINGSNFTTDTYTVNTSSSTVYMKNGKLNSIDNLILGQKVMIFGILDSTMNIIQAKGINILN